MPVWHASIARIDLGSDRAIPVRRWGAKHHAKAYGRAATLLAGVGEGRDFREDGDYCIHLRRKLTPAEMARIDPAWLAAPAIDEG
jgi:hypothetical protein